jgi:putative restriction endonuclease
MSRETTLAAFATLHRARWQGEEAPHKPLLVLFALGQWVQAGITRFPFADIEDPIRELIREFGFVGTPSADPRLPFWHLTTDRVWVVETSSESVINYSGRRPSAAELREQGAQGRFADPVAADLYSSPGLVVELIGQMLCECFEPAVHQHLLQRLGLWVR